MGVSRYPTDKSQSSGRVQSKQCAIDWIETYPVDNVIQLYPLDKCTPRIVKASSIAEKIYFAIKALHIFSKEFENA